MVSYAEAGREILCQIPRAFSFVFCFFRSLFAKIQPYKRHICMLK